MEYHDGLHLLEITDSNFPYIDARARKLKVVSDDIFPILHPYRGPQDLVLSCEPTIAQYPG